MAWFDPETAAVVTILLGLFQVVLSVPLAYSDQTMPKFYVLPLVLGIVIAAGGSFTMATERNPNRQLLQGCAYSNVVGLLGTLIAFCLYCYNLNTVKTEEPCAPFRHDYDYRHSYYDCPGDLLRAYCWTVTVLLLLYDTLAVVLHCLLSVSAFKALKSN